MNPQRFVIADDDELVLRTVRRCLEDLGHVVVTEASSGQGLIDAVIDHRPDLVITDIKLLGMDGLEATKIFMKAHRSPVIVISGCNDQPTFERASICPVQAYLTKPIKLSSLAAAIVIALRRFEETQQLQEEVQVGRRRLAERAIIEKAKGVLMKRAQIDETAAYERIRTMARSSSRTMGEIAGSLLLAEEALTDPTSERTDLPSVAT